MTGVDADAGRARSFGVVAEEYDRWRPDYPAAAVDWLAPLPPARVADVGAGTGKMTALLVARGLRVEAIEPDARMLAVLQRNVPGARPSRSDSTSIPVEDRSLDAVVVADAWHWFEPEKTITEVRRVLKPGGWLGLVWNIAADAVDDWEIELARAQFPDDELQTNRFGWTREMTPEARAAQWATTSMAIAMSPEDRAARFETDLDEFQRICDQAGRSSMPVRLVASCIRWTPKPQA